MIIMQLGCALSGIGLAAWYIEAVDWYLAGAALVLGIIVGLVALRQIIMNSRRALSEKRP
ncbi:MAG: hypothetical protein JSV90_07745 [Methanobacteriota archaeon]|nr:MAG: hypothetical protein JSV90_07745 [Euryarchaeota archaeon]